VRKSCSANWADGIGLGSTTLVLSWTASTATTSAIATYQVYLNGSKVGSTATTGYSFTGLRCATSYSLGVRAADGRGRRSGDSVRNRLDR